VSFVEEESVLCRLLDGEGWVRRAQDDQPPVKEVGSVPFALLLDGAGPTIRGQVGQQRRGAADRGKYREAAGAAQKQVTRRASPS
jgi:hypothetical protein